MTSLKINKKYLIVLMVFLATGFILSVKYIGFDSIFNSDNPDVSDAAEVSESELGGQLADEIEKVLTIEEQYPHAMARNVPLYTYLRELDVPSIDIIEMAKAAKPIKNLSSLLPGTRFQIVKDNEDKLIEVEFRFSAVEKLVVKKTLDEQKNVTHWQASLVTEVVDIRPISFVGHVDSTLWESALKAKMDPYLIIAMAEIFGWEVDFNREVQVGDSWRITAEQKFVKNQAVGWGSVLAAEYINQGKKYSAVLFRKDDEDMGYFNLEGENLRRMFLKSPLRFGRVTSRFNRRRFHPKLRVVRPHNGVDYGVPIGTPVRSVANGTVIFAQYSGGGGRVLKIRHNSTYQTAYKHLSGYAKGVRQGAAVKQGQIVAYSGNTGLSTGPHLHYEFYVNGRFVDPMRQKFPSADPISQEDKSVFLK
jgi:murein DD-endopeptidase MepM/ murein hydrolase activator NlpD